VLVASTKLSSKESIEPVSYFFHPKWGGGGVLSRVLIEMSKSILKTPGGISDHGGTIMVLVGSNKTCNRDADACGTSAWQYLLQRLSLKSINLMMSGMLQPRTPFPV
jgi:hypothetical protein